LYTKNQLDPRVAILIQYLCLTLTLTDRHRPTERQTHAHMHSTDIRRQL